MVYTIGYMLCAQYAYLEHLDRAHAAGFSAGVEAAAREARAQCANGTTPHQLRTAIVESIRALAKEGKP